MKLYVIRHGETYWNHERRLQGHEGSDLTEEGIRMAEKTAEGMRDISLDLCITSPLLRARHTTDILLKNRKIPVLEDDRLMEIGFGDWEGIHLDELIHSRESKNWETFMKDPYHYNPPAHAESIYDLLGRTGELFQEIIHNPEYQDRSILISTHGCALRGFLNPLYENRMDFWQGGVPANCSVSIAAAKDGQAELVEQDHLYY